MQNVNHLQQVCGWHVMGVVGYEGNDGAKKRVAAFVEILFTKEEKSAASCNCGICKKDLQISI